MSSTGIEYKSFFKSAFIDWKEVKSIGCYVVIRYSTQEIPMNEVSKLNIWGQKFLYVSTAENYVVKWGQKVNNTFIDFHYRPEMLELIKEHMKPNSIASLNF